MNWLYIFVPVILTLIAIGVAAGWSPTGKKFRNALIAGAATAIVAGLISTVVFLAVKAPTVVEKQVVTATPTNTVPSTATQPPATPTPYPTYTPYPTWTPVPSTNTPVPTDTKTSVPPSPTSVPPTATSTPTTPPTPTSAPTQSQQSANVTSACRDGEVIGNERNPLDRTPVGLAENNVAIEVSWPGSGFGGFNRFVLVVPKLDGAYQVFLNKVATIHMTRYCGSLAEVETYLSNPTTHVAAMRTTAADGQGNMPTESEIGVYSLDLASGTLKALKPALAGPSVDDVRNHVEVVRLK